MILWKLLISHTFKFALLVKRFHVERQPSKRATPVNQNIWNGRYNHTTKYKKIKHYSNSTHTYVDIHIHMPERRIGNYGNPLHSLEQASLCRRKEPHPEMWKGCQSQGGPTQPLQSSSKTLKVMSHPDHFLWSKIRKSKTKTILTFLFTQFISHLWATSNWWVRSKTTNCNVYVKNTKTQWNYYINRNPNEGILKREREREDLCWVWTVI